MENNPAVPLPIVKEKKRYEWIDNARIIAAFLILLNHLLGLCGAHFGGDLGSTYIRDLVLFVPLMGRVPLFLILAGYFLSRNVTWAKAWDRFLWLLIPFMGWNLMYYFVVLQKPLSVAGFFTYILGLNAIIHPDLFSIFGSEYPSSPCIPPSWFLRDIMFLSLLAPIIVKFKAIIPAVLVLFVSISFLQRPIAAGALFSCGTVFFFIFGVYLSRFRIAEIEKVFNKSFTVIVLCCIVFIVGMMTYVHLFHIKQIAKVPLDAHCATMVGHVLGAMIICHGGVLIERHLPRISKFLAPCGPACFLVFMLHYPALMYLRQVIPAQLWNSWWVLLIVPVPLFTLIVLFFLGMKRYTPWLMPYLGHMKVKKPAPAPESSPAA